MTLRAMGQRVVVFGAVLLVWVSGCCPCDSSDPSESPDPAPPALTTPAVGTVPAAPAADPGACTGDNASSELPCQLPDRRWGWCKHGRCKDICPAGYSYSHLDTACHKPCGPGCERCMDNACLDEATTRPLLED